MVALDFILKARFQTVVITTFDYNQKAHITMRKSIPACENSTQINVIGEHGKIECGRPSRDWLWFYI